MCKHRAHKTTLAIMSLTTGHELAESTVSLCTMVCLVSICVLFVTSTAYTQELGQMSATSGVLHH